MSNTTTPTAIQRIINAYPPVRIRITTPARQTLPPATELPPARRDPAYAGAGR
jgi:hypothetical protein